MLQDCFQSSPSVPRTAKDKLLMNCIELTTRTCRSAEMSSLTK